MRNQISGQVIGIPISEMPQEGLLCITSNQYYASPKFRQMKMGPKLSETVKRKLRLGAKVLQVGGVKKVFKQNFSVNTGEKLIPTPIPLEVYVFIRVS